MNSENIGTTAVKLFLGALLLVVLIAPLQAQSTAFTYQGYLEDGSEPANGTYDFLFSLFDQETDGSQVGESLPVSGVNVVNGAFSVILDFGDQFSGSPRWLEISVQPGQPVLTGGPTLLSPRQRILSAPYSIRSTRSGEADTAANALQLGGVDAGQYVVTTDPRLSDARSPLPGNAGYIQNTQIQQAGSNFNISGDGTAGGTFSGSIVNAETQFNLGGSAVLRTIGPEGIGLGIGVSPTVTGAANTIVGNLAGEDAADGSDNSYFGNHAGRMNISGSGNSIFGAYAGRNNTSYYNAFFGFAAGLANTSGGENAFFGSFSGHGNSSGTDNSFFGDSSGDANTTGDFNTFIGAGAGRSITTGNGNTMIGARANGEGSNLENASAIGANARVSKSNALVLGGVAGVNGATANILVGIGTTSPDERLHVVGNTVITGNLLVGGNLLANLPGGSNFYVQNTTSPQVAANFNITGTGKAGVFEAATQFNIGGNRILSETGFDNIFMGNGAGVSVTSGSGNAFAGRSAGNGNTTGSSNAFFGYLAGLANSSGSDNAFFGKSAGGGNTTASRSSFFGSNAGSVTTTGTNNSALGYNANFGGGTISNGTAIGANALVSQSNSIVLGSIFGINGGTADTKVGIGTPIPAERLHVVGNGLVTGNFVVGNSMTRRGQLNLYSNSGNADFYMQAANATVGINMGVSAASTFFLAHYDGTTYSDRLVITSSGTVKVNVLGSAGSTSLCRNASSELATCSSSIRYKSNVETFRGGREILRLLRPVSFTWKGSGTPDLGLVAEEVAEIEPRLATYGDGGIVEGVKYDRIGVVLLNVVREQQEEIERLREALRSKEADLRSLENRLTIQEKAIEQLKQLICSQNPAGAICKRGEQ